MADAPIDWVDVLRALEKGDPEAAEKVTSVITGFLARYRAYELRESWDDLCQEVLIALIRSVRQNAIREPSAFISYTGTITRNLLLDWIRRENRQEGGDLPHWLRANGERRDLDLLVDLRHALKDLDEGPRRVVEAIYLQGYTYEAAAEKLGLPLGTLKRTQTRALRELRQKMGLKGGSS